MTACSTAGSLDAYVERRCERNTERYPHPGRRRTPFVDMRCGHAAELESKASLMSQEPITPFHCKETPEVSLQELARVIRHHCRCCPALLTVGHILMARYELRTGTAVTAHMMHRLYSTCVLVGSKVHCDAFAPNDVFARVVGVPLWELNALEVALLRDLDWRVMVYEDAINSALADPACIYTPALHGSALATDHSLLFTSGSDGSPSSPVRSPALGSYAAAPPALRNAGAVMDLFADSTSLNYGGGDTGSLDGSTNVPASYLAGLGAPPSNATRGTDDQTLESPAQPEQPSPAQSVSSLNSIVDDDLCAAT